jgi:hypothetical protein
VVTSWSSWRSNTPLRFHSSARSAESAVSLYSSASAIARRVASLILVMPDR